MPNTRACQRASKPKASLSLASRPPDDDKFLITRLWKQFGFDVKPEKSFRHDDNKEANDRLVAKIWEMIESAKHPQGPQRFSPGELADPQQLAIQRKVPLKRGKWRMFSPDVKADTK